MEKFTYQDIEDYYDQTEVHYRMFWKLDKSLGLHYGIWNKDTPNAVEAILNVNRELIKIVAIKKTDYVLDAGCGIGGSSVFMAEKAGCKTAGLTLSQKQVISAKAIAKKRGLSSQCEFYKRSYTESEFPANTFDHAWAIESLGSAQNKGAFFKEMHRVLKPGGKILIADTLKPFSFDINEHENLKAMLNGWAISDILSVDEMKDQAKQFGFKVIHEEDVSSKIVKSVKLMYHAGLLGRIGAKAYNLFKNASPFSKIHYKTGITQKKAFDRGEWKYYLLGFEKI